MIRWYDEDNLISDLIMMYIISNENMDERAPEVEAIVLAIIDW